MAKQNYTDEEKLDVVQTVCGDIASNMSIAKACKLSGISKVTYIRWIAENNHYARLHVAAKEERADLIFEEMLEIADTPVEEKITVDGDEFSSVTRKDAIQHRRLQVDTRKWILSRMNPKKYGDKIEQHVTTGKSLPDWMSEGDE